MCPQAVLLYRIDSMLRVLIVAALSVLMLVPAVQAQDEVENPVYILWPFQNLPPVNKQYQIGCQIVSNFITGYKIRRIGGGTEVVELEEPALPAFTTTGTPLVTCGQIGLYEEDLRNFQYIEIYGSFGSRSSIGGKENITKGRK